MKNYQLTNENSLIIQGIRASFSHKKVQSITEGDNIDWNYVFDEANNQAVASLVYDGLSELNIPIEIKNKWKKECLLRVVFFQRICYAQDKLKQLLDEKNIPFVILKGTAAAIYYNNPGLRSFGDVDLIVKPELFDQAHDVLIADGYTLEEHDCLRHNCYRKNGICFEMHRYFSSLADESLSSFLDKLIFDGIDNRQVSMLGQYSFPVLTSLENGLVLLSHMYKHIYEGIGLRHVIDWVMYVDAVLDDNLWYHNFGPIVQRAGLDKLAKSMAKMGYSLFNIEYTNRTWFSDIEDKTCLELMHFVLKSGNFGRKDRVKHDSRIILEKMTEKNGIFATLQKQGMTNWSTVKQHPSLKLFAWAYQAIQYAKKGFATKSPLRSFKESIYEIHLLKSLGIKGLKDETISETPTDNIGTITNKR